MACLNPDHIFEDYDIAIGDENFDIPVPLEQDYYYDFGIQVVWTDVTNGGAFDGELTIQHSIDGINFADYGLNETIDSANGNAIFMVDEILAQTIRVEFEANQLTGGDLNIYLIRKRRYAL
jgi:hypothetical protein